MAELENKSNEPGADDFLIAADLTLYSNPVNRFMASAKAQKAEQQAKQNAISGNSGKKEETEAPKQQHHGAKHTRAEAESIAADLTLYRGPMAALDAMHENQRVRNIQDGKRDDHHHYNKK
ncbi:uncharacterized protein LOC135488281 isoform X2 [Lineus longissimus]|uniref:uncharacterized protein LOC135488281 isoform X2 n=1 Tax=Lineus longissimus TaxID=88925 RepID=UPI002B4F1F9F